MYSRRMVFVFVLLLVVLAYAGGSYWGYLILTSTSLQHDTQTPTGAFEDVRFPSRGQLYPVAAFFLPGKPDAGALIYAHGYRGNRRNEYDLSLVTALHDTLGYTVLSVDLSDSGGDTVGNNRISMGYSEKWDVLGGYDYLLTRGFAPDRIGLVGTSMGAATVLLAAALEPRIPAIWADSPYARVDKVLMEQAAAQGYPPIIMPGGMLWALLLTGDRLWEASPIFAVPAIVANHQKVYIVHGEKDSVVQFHHGQELQAALQAAGASVTLWALTNLDHTQAFTHDPTAYLPFPAVKPRYLYLGIQGAFALDRFIQYNMGTNTFRSNKNVFFSCKYHVVFCPKYRRKVLVDGIDVRLKEIISQVANDLSVDILELEVMPDHVHIVCEVDPQLGIHKFVKYVKGRSSRLLRQEFQPLRTRLPTLWTNSYFVATVGGAPLSVIKQYIENQKSV